VTMGFTRVLDAYLSATRRTERPDVPHFPREHAAVGKPAKKLIETYLRQGRILKQSEDERGENKDTSVKTRDYPWDGQ